MSDNKKVYMAVAAGALLVGGAVLLHLFGKGTDSTDNLMEDIRALGEPKKMANGFLEFPFFLKVFKLVMRHSKEKNLETK